MNIEVELEKAIEKYKDKQADIGEIRIDYLAEDCLREIRRLKEIIEFYKNKQEECCEWCEIASACEYEVTFFRDDDRWATTKSLMPKFCPNCGRKLRQNY